MSNLRSSLQDVCDKMEAEATELKTNAKKIKRNHRIVLIRDAAVSIGFVVGATVTAYVMARKTVETQTKEV